MSYEEKSNELLQLHKMLQFQFGSLGEEFPEQVMSMMYLTGDEKVLELGGNIGRNSMIIAYILNKKNNHNFVSFETNSADADKLKYNRDTNGFKFYIENAALSERKLIQKGWDTIPSDHILPGYVPVNTISWKAVKDKYNIDFDTLVIDCEGAFYYILQDTPEILDGIKLLIMENDYFRDNSHKQYVFNTLRNNNYVCVFQRALDNPNIPDFYQVWKLKE
jgi:FkbM family methyltransferase